MVKKLEIRALVPECSAQTFWSAIYDDPQVTVEYFLAGNKNANPEVSQWEDGQRKVTFEMPVSLPEVVKRMVGLDAVRVAEVQRVVWHSGSSFTVTSETQVTNISGSSRFNTVLQLSVSEEPLAGSGSGAPPDQQLARTGSGGLATTAAAAGGAAPVPAAAAAAAPCSLALTYGVKCSTRSVPWPMSATIENIMVEKALKSMQLFLDFTTGLLEQRMAQAEAAAIELPAMPASPDGAQERPAAGGGMASPGRTAALGRLSSFAGCTSVRHRWPSITTMDFDIEQPSAHPAGMPSTVFEDGDVPGWLLEQPSLQHRHPGLPQQPSIVRQASDAFADALETFPSSGGASGYSSDGEGHMLPSRLSHPHTSVGQGPGFSSPSAAAAAAGGAVAVAPASLRPLQQLQHITVAVDRLASAMQALDGKVERMLGQHAQAQQQQQQQWVQQQRRQPPLTTPAPGGAAGSGRWWLMALVALLLAAVAVETYLLLHPHATGLKPRGPPSHFQAASVASPALPIFAVRAQSVSSSGGDNGDGGGSRDVGTSTSTPADHWGIPRDNDEAAEGNSSLSSGSSAVAGGLADGAQHGVLQSGGGGGSSGGEGGWHFVPGSAQDGGRRWRARHGGGEGAAGSRQQRPAGALHQRAAAVPQPTAL